MIISKCINYCIILESTNSTKKNRQEELCLNTKDDVSLQNSTYYFYYLFCYTYHFVEIKFEQPDTIVSDTSLKSEEDMAITCVSLKYNFYAFAGDTIMPKCGPLHFDKGRLTCITCLYTLINITCLYISTNDEGLA